MRKVNLTITLEDEADEQAWDWFSGHHDGSEVSSCPNYAVSLYHTMYEKNGGHWKNAEEVKARVMYMLYCAKEATS